MVEFADATSTGGRLKIDHRAAVDAAVEEFGSTGVFVAGHKAVVIDESDAELFPFESERIAFLRVPFRSEKSPI
jgi:hypothetical protein